ncbi:helix-turn-helix transcriptional regulator [Candidatus Bathyarchaeota archaeon]|nr:helix-turn-helix transcriptional regulator [Candidatus Bathyarchaeota archaeon]
MPFRRVHPKAYLTTKRNVSKGLQARTKILETIEKGAAQAGKVSVETGLSYSVVTYHLRMMRDEGVVEPSGGKRPLTWTITRFGQQSLAL